MGDFNENKRLKFPKWVNEAYKEMSSEEIEGIIKSLLYLEIKPHEDGFEISEALQTGSNRVPVLDTIEHCLWSLETTMVMSAWSRMHKRGEIEFREVEDEED